MRLFGHLQVMMSYRAGAGFTSGCPEVPPGDPRGGQADEMRPEGRFSAPWRGNVGELRRCFEGFRGFALARRIVEAHICPWMAFLPVVNPKVCSKGCFSTVRYWAFLLGGNESKSVKAFPSTLVAK